MMPSLPVARAADDHRLHRRRSRNGCLTCKRRKVRCNEQRPQCYHCQRLNRECVWDDASPLKSAGAGGDLDPAASHAAASALDIGGGWPSPCADLFGFAPPVTDPSEAFSLFQDIYLPDFDALQHERALSSVLDAPGVGSAALPAPPPPAPPQSPPLSPDDDDADVEDWLLQHAPPILDPVENGPICASVRALIDTMAVSSPMVRYSIAAFAAMHFHTAGEKVDYQQYYDKAADELSARFHTSELKYVLTTIFFLTYINFLTGRLDLAYLNLAKAHNALQTSGRGALGSLEQRIISWIRWSDARAALAGGEGLLVNDTSGLYPPSLASSSPPSSDTQLTIGAPAPAAPPGAREAVYDLLCQPGIAFFQEVQTLTGRITRIAHYHRSRGSVEDETEVMAIAAEIQRDLASLYERRPPLMDLAVAGALGGDALAPELAASIARSFMTYLANFYVCYVHLHRVAHRHLARSRAVDTALGKIKEVMHRMVAGGEAVPVNMLWPLFLWGSEEDDEGECEWIVRTIRGVRHVVTNANMTADVLQEIQRRQREEGARVDIRSVCLELFNATFAII